MSPFESYLNRNLFGMLALCQTLLGTEDIWGKWSDLGSIFI